MVAMREVGVLMSFTFSKCEITGYAQKRQRKGLHAVLAGGDTDCGGVVYVGPPARAG